MEMYRETSTKVRGGSVSVRNFLPGSGSGSVTFEVGDLGFVGVNFQEDVGVAFGVPQTGDGKYVQAA